MPRIRFNDSGDPNLRMAHRICANGVDSVKNASKSAAEEVPDPYHGGARGFDIVLDYIEDASQGLTKVLIEALKKNR